MFLRVFHLPGDIPYIHPTIKGKQTRDQSATKTGKESDILSRLNWKQLYIHLRISGQTKNNNQKDWD